MMASKVASLLHADHAGTLPLNLFTSGGHDQPDHLIQDFVSDAPLSSGGVQPLTAIRLQNVGDRIQSLYQTLFMSCMVWRLTA